MQPKYSHHVQSSGCSQLGVNSQAILYGNHHKFGGARTKDSDSLLVKAVPQPSTLSFSFTV